MVLKFVLSLGITLAILLGNTGFAQPPKLVLSAESIVAINVDAKVLGAVVGQSWNDEHWAQVFRAYTWHAHSNQMSQPIAGHYHVEKMAVYFTPLFPFSAGETYFAEFDYGALQGRSSAKSADIHRFENGEKVDLIFSIPEVTVPATFIEGIYPSSDTLPENLLRMYIYFSAPMSSGDAYSHIHLRDESGRIMEKSFLIVDQELWDTDRRRFTLLFDPGRIKRGIQSNFDLGTTLQHNRVYRLMVDSSWRDERGNSLLRNVEKKIVVTTADREKLTIERWKIHEPHAGSNSPLVVQFGKTLDHVLAVKYLAVTDALSNVIEGNALMKDGDTTWAFYPDRPWAPGRYALQIYPHLEDPAGNNFNNPFDVDLSVTRRVYSEAPIQISFEVSEEIN